MSSESDLVFTLLSVLSMDCAGKRKYFRSLPEDAVYELEIIELISKKPLAIFAHLATDELEAVCFDEPSQNQLKIELRFTLEGMLRAPHQGSHWMISDATDEPEGWPAWAIVKRLSRMLLGCLSFDPEVTLVPVENLFRDVAIWSERNRQQIP